MHPGVLNLAGWKSFAEASAFQCDHICVPFPSVCSGHVVHRLRKLVSDDFLLASPGELQTLSANFLEFSLMAGRASPGALICLKGVSPAVC